MRKGPCVQQFLIESKHLSNGKHLQGNFTVGSFWRRGKGVENII